MLRIQDRSGCITGAVAVLGFLILLCTFFFVQYHQENRAINARVPPQNLSTGNSYDEVMLLLDAKPANPVGPTSSSNDPRENWSNARLKAFSDAQRPTMDAIWTAMEDRPFVRPRSIDLNTRPNSQLRTLARDIIDETYYRIRIQDYPAAVEPLTLGFDMGLRTGNGGGAIDNMVASAVFAITCHGYYELAEYLEVKDLERLEVLLQKSFEGRGALALIYQEELFEMLRWIGFLNTLPHLESSKVRLLTGSDRRNARELIGYYEKWMKASEGYYDPNLSFPKPEIYVQVLDMPGLPDTDIENSLFRIYSLNSARYWLVRTDIALRLYQKQYGSYPKDLKALVPEFLPEVPVDPMAAGKPLSYRPLEDGRKFLLYSYGANCKDNGGTPGKAGDPDGDADLVAGTRNEQD